MLGGDLEASADVVDDQFVHIAAAGICHGDVITDAAAYETFLDGREGVDCAVDVEEGAMVDVHVFTYRRKCT